jgi:hypothetical protein
MISLEDADKLLTEGQTVPAVEAFASLVYWFHKPVTARFYRGEPYPAEWLRSQRCWFFRSLLQRVGFTVRHRSDTADFCEPLRVFPHLELDSSPDALELFRRLVAAVDDRSPLNVEKYCALLERQEWYVRYDQGTLRPA